MNMKILLALAALAGALPEALPLFVPADKVPHALALLSAIGALLTGLMRSPFEQPPPHVDKPRGKVPPIPPPLMLTLLALTLVGCGSVRPDVADARSITESVFDCVDSASTADDIDPALFACGVETLRVVSVLCSSGVIPRGAFCDRVGKLVQ